MNNLTLLSPLRYPGSKRRLVGFIKQALNQNNIWPKVYVEPFVGGASVALQLMQDEIVERVILIDKDPLITGFWRTVFFDSDWLIEQIETIDVTLQNWYKFKSSNPKTIREQALTCIFLNRTNFSGILESKVGPIGGKEQNSKYKIYCRFPRETLARRIKQAATHKDKIVGVWECSWDKGLKKIKEEQRRGIIPTDGFFYYFDPPFFNKAKDLYRYYFHQEDHLNLRDLIVNIKDPWILSYDSAEQVDILYGEAIKKRENGTLKRHIELLYSLPIATRRIVKEVILSNLEKLPSDVYKL